MSDAPALSRLQAPATETTRDQPEDLAFARGLVNALLLALPLWALIGFGVSRLF
jgi:hypothetical protein